MFAPLDGSLNRVGDGMVVEIPAFADSAAACAARESVGLAAVTACALCTASAPVAAHALGDAERYEGTGGACAKAPVAVDAAAAVASRSPSGASGIGGEVLPLIPLVSSKRTSRSKYLTLVGFIQYTNIL